MMIEEISHFTFFSSDIFDKKDEVQANTVFVLLCIFLFHFLYSIFFSFFFVFLKKDFFEERLFGCDCWCRC